jgi:hypothetical protein
VTIVAAILLSAGVADGRSRPRRGNCSPRRWSAAPAGPRWAACGATPSSRRGFVRTRPVALGTAYNGASLAGLIFSPLWVFAIALMGFLPPPRRSASQRRHRVVLARAFFARTPHEMALAPDGDAPGAARRR